MRYLTKILLLAFIVLHHIDMAGQDSLIFKSGDVVLYRVIEISAERIHYQKGAAASQVTYVIPTTSVARIKFESGEEDFTPSSLKFLMTKEENALQSKKGVFKFAPFSPINNSVTLGIELVAGTNVNLEAEVGIIIPRKFQKSSNYEGFFMSFGPKFLLHNDDFKGHNNRSNILHGYYLRPELTFENRKARANYITATNPTAVRLRSYGLLFNAGKQWVLTPRFVVDIYAGLGMGYSKLKLVRKGLDPDKVSNLPSPLSIIPLDEKLERLTYIGNLGFKIGFLF